MFNTKGAWYHFTIVLIYVTHQLQSTNSKFKRLAHQKNMQKRINTDYIHLLNLGTLLLYECVCLCVCAIHVGGALWQQWLKKREHQTVDNHSEVDLARSTNNFLQVYAAKFHCFFFVSQVYQGRQMMIIMLLQRQEGNII